MNEMKFEFLTDRIEFFDEVAEILYEEWGSEIPGNRFEDTLERVNVLLNRKKVPLCTLYTEGDVLVGFYTLNKTQQANTIKASPWLGSVYVKPAYRNRGIGTKLVEHALALSKDFGVKNLYLQTRDKQEMYYRMGFKHLFEAKIGEKVVSVMRMSTENREKP